MNLEYREMSSDEGREILRLAKGSFGFTEQLMMSRPKNAILAVSGDEVVGGAAYKIFKTKGGQLTGFIELMFVKAGHGGKGIGNAMYREATENLKKRGCAQIFTMVRDDNVASWKAFENAGYNRTTFMQMLRYLGLPSALLIWFVSLLCVGIGHESWSTLPEVKSSLPGQLMLYGWLVVLGSLPALRHNGYFVTIAALLILLAGAVLGGAAAVAVSKEQWVFRVTRGGMLISFIVAFLGGIFPVVGRYYPLRYQRTMEFRRELGIEALLEWLAPAVILGTAYIFRERSQVLTAVVSMAPSVLLYHSLPIFPFGSYGGTRLWQWNRILSITLLAVSLVLMYFL